MDHFSLVNYIAQALHWPNLGPWAGFLLLLLLMAAMVRNIGPPDMIMLATAVLAALVGLMPAKEIFSGFADTAMLTVGAMYIIAAAMRETGALDTMGRWVLGAAKTERQVLWRMFGCITTLSAFLNNTPIVAMFIPVVTAWSKKHRVPASKLLMPLSFFTVLGGTCTLIGTSTNLVVQGLLTKAGLPPMTLFDLTWAGVPMAIIGGLYLIYIGSRWLPERHDLITQFDANQREYLINMRVDAGCRLIGKEVEEAGLRHLQGLFLTEIVRGEDLISPVRPDQRIERGDLLTFSGVVETIVELERIPGLTPAVDLEGMGNLEREMHEAVISPASPLVGRSIRDADFRAAYNASVLAVHRGGERLKGRIGDIELRPGDALLLQTGPHFGRAHANDPDFYLVSAVPDARPIRHERAYLSIALVVALIGLMASGLLSTAMASFLIAGTMIATRCISPNIARQSLDLQTLVTIAASFGVSEALRASGFVQVVADYCVKVATPYGPHALLFVFYALTMAFTEIFTHAAAAALMFPFAAAVAQIMHVHHEPFILAITYAASFSFMTPIGYQTNLMVYGPGGYRFNDFLRVGTPLNLLMLAIGTVLIPYFRPFT